MSLLDKIIDRRIARYQSDLLATHYAEVENMYRQTRGGRHDYRNHIQVLKNYAEMGDMEAVKGYLDELAENLNTVDLALKTGNKMTDVILNSKISLARSKEIQVRADAHVPMTLTTAQRKQKKENGRFASTKGSDRGYGLARIDTIIERYQGYIRRGSEDGAFTTEILPQ